MIQIIFLFCITIASASIHRLALVVGQNQGLISERPLRYAERDADRVASLLRKGDLFAPDEVYLLQSPNSTKVREVFAEIKGRIHELRKHKKETVFFVYYSGHGSKNGLHIDGESFSRHEWKSLFDNVNADMRVMVLDACESGDFLRGKGGVKRTSHKVEEILQSKGAIVLSSSAAGELAQESEKYKGGVFTHHFLNGLKGLSDFNQDKKVSVLEAFQYARSATQRENIYGKSKQQNPSYDLNTFGKKDPILNSFSSGQATLILQNIPVGMIDLYNARTSELVSHLFLVGAKSTELQLPKGEYILTRQNGDAFWAANAHLAWNNKTVIKESDFRKQAQNILYARGGQHLKLNPHGFHGGVLWRDLNQSWVNHYFAMYQYRSYGWNMQVLFGFSQNEDVGSLRSIDNSYIRGQIEVLKPFWHTAWWMLSLGGAVSTEWIHQDIRDLRIRDELSVVEAQDETSGAWRYGGHLPLLGELYFPYGFWAQGGGQLSIYTFGELSSLQWSWEPRVSLGWTW